MLPSVQITKVDGGTGVVRPAATGVLAIIAPVESGDVNVAQSFARRQLVQDEFGHGAMLEDAAHVMAQTRKPIVAVGVTGATAGAYGAVTMDGEGTSVVTAGATEPLDRFLARIRFTVGGTVGVTGARYKYSLDDGATESKEIALGTANTITIPESGVSFALGAGTLLAGETVSVSTTGPKMTNADVPNALEALRVTSLGFDAVLLDMEADATTVSTCVTWLGTMATKGRFPTIVLNARPRNSGESETAYRTALQGIFDAAAGNDIVVCADLGDVASVVRGISQPRPAALFVAARGMSIGRGVDPAWVELGPLPGVRITDERGNPKYHDENNYPGLDDLRLTTLRTFDGFQGVYITNANLLSASGSDYVYWQHARTINRGCEIAFQSLTRHLSRGVRKSTEIGPAGERYIAETDAQILEENANAAINRELVAPGEVDDMRMIVSRTDDIRSNEGANITVSLQSVSLGYVKKFTVSAGFVTAIETPSAATG